MNKEIRPIMGAVIIASIGFLVVKEFLPRDADFYKNLLLAGGFGITIISWFVVGYINNENEKRRNKLNSEQSVLQDKRTLRMKFLLDAYFRLENANKRDMAPPDNDSLTYDFIYLKYIESALASVQLLGNEVTIKLANAFILSHGKQHLTQLLSAIRDELREELSLSILPKENQYHPTCFRVFRKKGAPNAITADQQYELTLRLVEINSSLIKW